MKYNHIPTSKLKWFDDTYDKNDHIARKININADHRMDGTVTRL